MSMTTLRQQKSRDKSVIVVDFRKNQEVKRIPQPKQLPLELKLLVFLQKSSSICSLLLVTVTLAIFGLTVRIPEKWNTEYRRLTTLQRQERQLTTTNEIQKSELLRQKENQNNSLVYPTPEQALFLSISPTENNPESITQQSNPVDVTIIKDSPLGY